MGTGPSRDIGLETHGIPRAPEDGIASCCRVTCLGRAMGETPEPDLPGPLSKAGRHLVDNVCEVVSLGKESWSGMRTSGQPFWLRR